MTKRTNEPTETVRIECDIAAPPEKVWRALSEPELVAEWLAPNGIDAREGSRFELALDRADGGRVACTVLDAEPPLLLRYSWRGEPSIEDRDGRTLDSVVTFRLATIEGGTRLTIEHSGLPALAIAAPMPRRRPVEAIARRRLRTVSIARRRPATAMLRLAA